MVHALLNETVANYAAMVAIVACVFFTVELARRLPVGGTQTPQTQIQMQQVLFNSLVFFALSWAALVPFYSAPKSDVEEIRAFLPAYQGLLFALAGCSLRRYCLMRQGNNSGVGKFDRRVLSGLYALVVALIFVKEIKLPNSAINLPMALLVGIFFDAVGYYLIVQRAAELTQAHKELKFWGLRFPVSNSNLWRWLAIASFLYFTFDLIYAVQGLRRSIDVIHHDPITPPLVWIFALLKLNLCAPFLLIVRHEATSPRAAMGQAAR